MFDKNYDISQNKQASSIVAIHKFFDKKSVFTHMHYHDDFEIIYIVHGKVFMIIDGVKFNAEEGSVILINPYETHYGEMIDDKLEYYCIDFPISALSLETENDLMTRRRKYENHISDFNSISNNIVDTFKAYDDFSDSWDLLAKANLLMIFYNLSDKISKFSGKNKEFFEKKVIDYVSENFSNQITSNDVAASLGYNQNYFCRAFKRSFGCRFCDYLNDYRIKTAKSMLADSSPSEIWEKLGFSSYFYFSTVFKKLIGTSPSKYKSNHYS